MRRLAWVLLVVACRSSADDSEPSSTVEASAVEASAKPGSGAESTSGAPAVDPTTGLARDDGLALVTAHCTGCHSPQLIIQNRGDKARWRERIRWMQQTQKLWPIPEDQEAQILAYLERNYGPRRASRRPPLPPELMPPL